MNSGTGLNSMVFLDGDDDTKNMIEYGNECRTSMKVINDQTVMLSFMWCTHLQQEMF